MMPVLGPVTSPASCICLQVNFGPFSVSIVASVSDFRWLLNLGFAPGPGSHSNLCSEAVARTVQPEFLNAPTFPTTATFTQRPYSGAAADALAAATTLAVSAAASGTTSIPDRLMCPSYPQAEPDCTRPLPRAAPARGRA